ncbi:MAG: CDP-glycerol glycerophosphotransferase family protein [Archaeoglobaceae archaeon]
MSKPRVVLLISNLAGSNTWALYKYYLKHYSGDLEILPVFENELQNNSEVVNEAKIIVTTFIPIKARKDQVCIQTWHGFPIKSLGILDDVDRNDVDYLTRMIELSDFWLSYSATYTTIINACFPHLVENYLLTGMPRNDFLFTDKSFAVQKLSTLIGLSAEELMFKRLILYCPTYRSTLRRKDSQISANDLYELINSRIFLDYLETSQTLLVVKLHPFEEHIASNLERSSKNIFLLRNSDLLLNKIDLYEFLPAFDLLVTDFSSIYFDWLLLNKPIVFFVPDLYSYSKLRDFLLSPLDFWMPGVKCKTVEELIEAVENSLRKDEFKKDRERLKRVVHHYQDGLSCKRVFSAMEEIINANIRPPQIHIKYCEGLFLPTYSERSLF